MGIESDIEKGVTDLEPILSTVGVQLPSKAEAEKEAGEIALTFAGSFGATFITLAKPALDAGGFGAEKAIIVSAAVAGFAAAVRAVKPLALKALAGLKKSPATPAAPAPTVNVHVTAPAPVVDAAAIASAVNDAAAKAAPVAAA